MAQAAGQFSRLLVDWGTTVRVWGLERWTDDKEDATVVMWTVASSSPRVTGVLRGLF